jgi:hypothetical protein
MELIHKEGIFREQVFDEQRKTLNLCRREDNEEEEICPDCPTPNDANCENCPRQNNALVWHNDDDGPVVAMFEWENRRIICDSGDCSMCRIPQYAYLRNGTQR